VNATYRTNGNIVKDISKANGSMTNVMPKTGGSTIKGVYMIKLFLASQKIDRQKIFTVEN
jgi:hypothetical protein